METSLTYEEENLSTGKEKLNFIGNENTGESRTFQEQWHVFLNIKEHPKGLR